MTYWHQGRPLTGADDEPHPLDADGVVGDLLERRRAPWPLHLDEEPGELWPTLGPVSLRLVDAGARLLGVAIVAAGLAVRAHRRARAT